MLSRICSILFASAITASVVAVEVHGQAPVAAQGAADLAQSSDNVEIEIYKDGTGVIRTYNGWYPISHVSTRDALRFQMDRLKEVPPNDLDRQILKRAAALFTSEAKWNRADDRKCSATATTLSIYCAEERASNEVTGGFPLLVFQGVCTVRPTDMFVSPACPDD